MNETDNFCGTGIIEVSNAYGKVHGYISSIVCLVGILGNVLNIIIFGRKEQISPVNIILRGMSAADLIVILFYLPYIWFTFLRYCTEDGVYSYGWAVFLLYHSYLSQAFHTIGIWLTIALGIWRYVAIAYPLRNKFWCNTTMTRRVVIAGYVICPILCAPIIYSFRVQSQDHKSADLTIPSSNESVTKMYVVTMQEPVDFMVKLNFVIYSILLRLVPSILLTILSVKLIHALMQSKKNRLFLTTKAIEREKQMDRITSMLLAVLFLFLVNEIPQSVLILLVIVHGKIVLIDCYNQLGDILDLLGLINSSAHFFLYYAISNQFRASLSHVICNRALEPERKRFSTTNGISGSSRL